MSMSPVPPVTEMDWPTAQHEVLAGRKIRRVAWDDPNACVFLAQFDDEYLVHRKPDFTLDKIILRGVDVRATDWVVVKEN